jgi:hypothetical protein
MNFAKNMFRPIPMFTSLLVGFGSVGFYRGVKYSNEQLYADKFSDGIGNMLIYYSHPFVVPFTLFEHLRRFERSYRNIPGPTTEEMKYRHRGFMDDMK